MNLTEFQQQVGQWHRRHWPELDTTRIVLKACEEVGELAKARELRIGYAAATVGPEMDAIGDTLVCLAALCDREGYDLEVIAGATLAEINSRNSQRIHCVTY